MIYRELRRRARRIVGSTLTSCVAGYFCYHMAAGKHGTMAWREISREFATKKETLSFLQAEQHVLERRVKLLRPSSLCLDLLDEQARKGLGLSGPNEIIVMHNQAN